MIIDKATNEQLMAVGLRSASEEEIRNTTAKYRNKGWKVFHKVDRMPYNGVLICRKKLDRPAEEYQTGGVRRSAQMI